MLVAIHVVMVLSCILLMPMPLGGHMAGALDTSSDSHTAPPPRRSKGNIFSYQRGGPCMSGPMLVAIHVAVVFSCILIMPMSRGGHMAGALDTSSDSHIAPPPE